MEENLNIKNRILEELENVGTPNGFVVLRREVLECKELNANEKLVYARIASFDLYYESKERCAEVLGLSDRIVLRAKNKLEKLGFIRCVKNTGRGKIYEIWYGRDTKIGMSDIPKMVCREERENKEKINTINSIKAKMPKKEKSVVKKSKKEMVELVDNNGEVYERSKRSVEIDECMAIWKEIMGSEIVGSEAIKKDRMAVNAMLNRKGWNVNSVRQLLNVVKVAYGDRYAGRKVKAVNLSEVMYNTNEIVAYAKAKMAEKSSGDMYEEI